MKYIKRGLVWLLAAALALGVAPLNARADFTDTGDNEFIKVKKTPTGKTGKVMTISFTITNDSGDDIKGLKVAFSEDVDLSDDAVQSGYVFPFEVTQDIFDYKLVGTLKAGSSKNTSLSARVRRDLSEGYYTVPIKIAGENGFAAVDEYINIWISKSTGTDAEEEDKSGQIGFAIGEGQNTPNGVYPEVMNFSLDLRNTSKSLTAYDVTVELALSPKSEEFPFEINDANYDRKYEKIGPDETVTLDYSMAIRSDVYSGYYPIKATIIYNQNSDSSGEVKSVEETFYVKVKNKEKEDELGDFNANDRTKARLIVDSYETIPAEVYAGQEFELILRMKNASTDIAASNILFSLESEKVSDSAVFTTEEGTSSVVVNRLGVGEVTEIRMKLEARAGVDQRSYGITVNEKFDSPEFKNAEEKVTIDIPVRQVSRLSTGTIEVMPESIEVGSETNVMFGINNTGKVLLYNVTAAFEAESIQPASAYVGNIKPGETGNVDVMLTGVAPTMDDGKVKITITYEDEYGESTSVEKELTMFVTEPVEMEFDDAMMGDMDNLEEKPSLMKKLTPVLIVVALILFTVIIVVLVKMRGRRKRAREEAALVDEVDVPIEESSEESFYAEGTGEIPLAGEASETKFKSDNDAPDTESGDVQRGDRR